MKMTDFDTLEDSHAYFTIKNKMVECGQMRVFMIMCGLYTYFRNSVNPIDPTVLEGLSDERKQMILTCQELRIATFDNLTSGEPFNFIEGHPSNVGGLFDMIYAGTEPQDVKDKLSQLKSMCIGFCNKKIYPYKDVTPEEFNQAKTSLTRNIRTVNTTTHYGMVNSSADKHVRVGNEKVRVTILLKDTAEFDRTFILEAKHKSPESPSFIDFNRIIHAPIKVAAGSDGAEVYLSVDSLDRYSLWSAVSETVGEFDLLIDAK